MPRRNTTSPPTDTATRASTPAKKPGRKATTATPAEPDDPRKKPGPRKRAGPRAATATPAEPTDTRERLIEAAIEIAQEEGLLAVGLREVARRAGVTHSAPYRHFTDRRDLIVAAAERGFHELFAYVVDRQRETTDDPLDRFWALGVAYFMFAITRPGLFRLMFAREASRAEQLRPAEGAVFSMCVGAIAAAQGAGFVVPGDVQKMALVAWSSMHGLAMLHLDGLTTWLGVADDPEHLAREISARVYGGFALR